jgi:hypothetical protein
MAIFTAIATAIGTAIGLTGTALTIFTAIGATVLSVGVSSLVAKRMADQGSGGTAGGGRVQLPPATDNKIPVIYGSAFVGGPIIDAKISVNQKFMWYVVALAEHTDTTVGSGYTFDTSNIYYEGKKVQFGSNGVVTGLINNSPGGTEIDTKVNGKIYIWLFTNGSSSGVNTGGQTAIQILSDSSTGGGIPVGYRWTATDTMTNCAFAIVRVEYNTDAGTTNLGALMCKMANSINKPGDAILDYMVNTRYGCAIPLSRIDTASLTALNAYSDETITYSGGSQVRYRINGPINTSNNCLNNLQVLVDSCDSWLQYSELTAKWRVIINQSYTDYTTIDNLFLVDSSNLIGGINVAPINLNETFNEMEVAYPNQYIKDQTDYQVILLEDYQPGIMSPNEAVNRLNLDFPVVNGAIQAKYLGIRRLLQSREDLTVTFKLDYSGIQIEAGDVIRIKQEVYGWDVLNSGKGKLFRVANVAEEKYSDGSLGVSIAAFEYNDTVYADQAITDFQPDPNLGISDPNIITKPDAPTVELLLANTIATMQVSGSVPNVGLVTNLTFNVGNDSNVSNHRYYTTVSNANGIPLTNGANFTIEASDLAANTYYWSVLARNQTTGISSDASNSVSWDGQNVTSATTFTACNASSSGTLITSDAIANLAIGGLVTITSGTGTLQANTIVANVVSNTQFNVNLVPTVALSNACISISAGGISGNNVQDGSIDIDKITPGTNLSEAIIGYGYSVANPVANTVTLPVNVTTIGANIKFESVNGNFETPKYVDDVYSGGGGYYPYYTGNSSTADGYLANSTSSYQPANAAVLAIQNGNLNWHAVDYQYFGTLIPVGQNVGYDWVASVVSNVDATIQTIPFNTVTGNLTEILSETNGGFNVYNLKQNQPIKVTANGVFTSTGVSDGAGILIRNFTSNANIVFEEGALVIYRSV